MLEVDIVKNLSGFDLHLFFRLTECGVTVVFGPSGSGKSTLINCIAGLETPDRGRICCGASVYFYADTGVNLPPEKRRLGYVFQDDRLFPHLSVRENLRFGLRFRHAPAPADAPDLEAVADLLNIAPLLQRASATLSGGERQRVAIGRALLCRPELLLMDEPISSLDLALKRDVLAYIARIPEHWNIPVLYVTHSPEEARVLGKAMLLLRHGRLAAQGSIPETLDRAQSLGLLPPTIFNLTGAAHESSYRV